MSRMLLFFFKQKTAYEMRISDWSSDVCSSDLFEQCPDLRRKRHTVGAAHLHLLGRQVPDRAVEVELGPLGLPQLSGTHEHVGREPERVEGDRVAGIEIGRAHV